ncbi:MAG: hypothetical protein RL001_272, partial [Pseudomonadota bacterium]
MSHQLLIKESVHDIRLRKNSHPGIQYFFTQLLDSN